MLQFQGLTLTSQISTVDVRLSVTLRLRNDRSGNGGSLVLNSSY